MWAEREAGRGPPRGQVAAFLCGLVLVFNMYLIPGSANGASPRLTDLMAVLLTVWVGKLFARDQMRGAMLGVMAALAVSPALYTVVALGGGLADEGTFSKTSSAGLRWCLALISGYILDDFVDDVRTRLSLVSGIIAGAVGNFLVIVLQSAGGTDLAISLGLAAPMTDFSWVHMVLRPAGMHGHANGSTAVVSLIIPAAFYLYWSGRSGAWVCVAGIGVVLLASSHTLSRGPLLATALTLGLSALVFRKVRATTPMFVLGGLLAASAITILGPPGGWDRWTAQEYTDENLSQRLETNLLTLELVANNPLGVGAVRSIALIAQSIGVPSSHNALLSATLCFGIPFGFLFTALLLTNILRGVASDADTLYFLMSLHGLLLFCFEDLLLTPTFIGLGGWLAVGAAARLFPPRMAPLAPAPRLPTQGRFR